jgi:hypothetical protein
MLIFGRGRWRDRSNWCQSASAWNPRRWRIRRKRQALRSHNISCQVAGFGWRTPPRNGRNVGATPAIRTNFVPGEPADPAQESSQILAVDILHRQEVLSVDLADIMNTAYVGMGDLPGQPHFVVNVPQRACVETWGCAKRPVIGSRPSRRVSWTAPPCPSFRRPELCSRRAIARDRGPYPSRSSRDRDSRQRPPAGARP